MTFDPTRAPIGQRYLWTLAQALHAGYSWREIARALGYPPRVYQAFYRPRVRSYVLRLLPQDDPPHGTTARAARGPCYRDGRRCEPCLAARADYQRRASNRSPVRTDPAFLQLVAKRLHHGDSWEQIATELGRTSRQLRDHIRELIQPYALELVEADQPSTTSRRHGTYAKYVVDRCRCEPCRWAHVRYKTARERRRRRGLQPFIDAGPVREHLAYLASEGLGSKQVSRLCGVAASSLAAILRGDQLRVRADTARRVLAVQPALHLIPDGARVPADVTWALIRWLLDRGATRAWISAQVGGDGRALQIGRRRVRASTARAVRRLVDDVRAGRVHVPVRAVVSAREVA